MKKSNVAVFICLLISVAGILKWLDYRHKLETGYCFSEKRYLSNQELTEWAVKGLLENLDAHYEGLSSDERSNVLKYESVNDFLELNPNCCGKIMSDPTDRDFWDQRMVAIKKGDVLSNYGFQVIQSIRYRYAKSGEAAYRRYRYMMSYCGKVRGKGAAFRIGEPVSKLPKK